MDEVIQEGASAALLVPDEARRPRNSVRAQDGAERLYLDIVEDAAGFACLRHAWGELFEASGQSIFNSWEWQFSWMTRLGQSSRPTVLTLRDREGQLRGLWALTLRGERIWGRRVRRLAFMGETNVGSDYLDILAWPGMEGAVTDAFTQLLLERRDRWDLLDLRDLRSDSPTVGRLTRALGTAGFQTRISDRHLCPFEALKAEPFDEFLRRTGRRDNYLRRRKWLEKQPGFRIEKTQSARELPRAMAEFFRLHRLRWASDGGSDGIQSDAVEAFHRDATELLAEHGRVRLYTLWLAEKALASVYGIRHGDRFLYFQSGYDPAWRSKSVGLVLVGETFKDALEEGLVDYDFLRGTESYKSDWTTQRRRTVAFRAFRPGAPGAWLHQVEGLRRYGREGVKAILPVDTVAKLRTLRRKWMQR